MGKARITVKTFGSVTDILEKEFDAEAPDTDSLLSALCGQHDALNGRKLLLAVNGKVVQTNTVLTENDVVAVMPPYSGG